jgi:hypothetical protein
VLMQQPFCLWIRYCFWCCRFGSTSWWMQAAWRLPEWGKSSLHCLWQNGNRSCPLVPPVHVVAHAPCGDSEGNEGHGTPVVCKRCRPSGMSEL